MRKRQQYRGFLLADSLMALAVVVILTMTLTVAATRQQRASAHLADSRATMRLAEATILAMQTGQPLPPAPEGMTISVRRAAASQAPPGGCTWAIISVAHGAHTTELIGLVRAGSLKGDSP
jgi:type II secretory pathway pseudopilin PulG